MFKNNIFTLSRLDESMLSECSSVHCTAYAHWGAEAVDLQIIDHFPDKTLSDQILNNGHH